MATATATLSLTNNPTLNRILRNSDMLLAVGAVTVLVMIILPFPVILLDLFMVLSLVSSMLILLMVIYTKSPLEFTIFPTLLLVTTLARIALNVASTRLILTKGATFDGKVVTAFADFVTSGNFVVGIVIFVIIIAFQMMVVTKGSTRVAEVAARFKLDSMPGKQMAIDADLNAGIIDEKEAVRRRTAIQDEADFYGSMDGATKFIQGDVRLALVLVIVNVIVGFIVGVAQRGESATEALQNYIRFSIGDGLVAAIPGLLVSVATGIIVTRSISKENLGSDFSNQLLGNYKAIFIAAGFALVLGFIPGFPHIWLFLTAGGLFFLGNSIRGAVKEGVTPEKTPLDEEKEEEERYAPEKMVDEVRVDPLEVELGYALIPLVNKAQGGDLLDRIKKMRKQIVLDLGLIVPNVRITDNMQLEAEEYHVKINGDQAGGSKLRMKKLLAMNTGGSAEKLAGEETQEPVVGLTAFWISEDEKENAERKGYTIVDGPTIVAT
ncbi:MAG: FHIPEP family type III secretion protein, partial [Spirochaetia bacterium]|nr:FHIPEP family type III secretion protein [Spirochaetia bacterium]